MVGGAPPAPQRVVTDFRIEKDSLAHASVGGEVLPCKFALKSERAGLQGGARVVASNLCETHTTYAKRMAKGSTPGPYQSCWSEDRIEEPKAQRYMYGEAT